MRITRVNPFSKAAFTARSTGTNEVDHQYLNRLLNSPSVGIHRAYRIMSDHYELSNDRKKVNRLGEKEALTHRTEKLYHINSLAAACGYADVELPFSTTSYPPQVPVREYLGFNFELPDAFADDVTETADDADIEELEDFLFGVNLEENTECYHPIQSLQHTEQF